MITCQAGIIKGISFKRIYPEKAARTAEETCLKGRYSVDLKPKGSLNQSAKRL